jgi:hypothetical protein
LTVNVESVPAAAATYLRPRAEVERRALRLAIRERLAELASSSPPAPVVGDATREQNHRVFLAEALKGRRRFGR